MADLTLSAGRPYSLVTTVVHRGHGALKFAQLELHLTTGDLRLRFLDQASLARFCRALGDLAHRAYLPDCLDNGPIQTRVYTDEDENARDAVRNVLLDHQAFGFHD